MASTTVYNPLVQSSLACLGNHINVQPRPEQLVTQQAEHRTSALGQYSSKGPINFLYSAWIGSIICLVSLTGYLKSHAQQAWQGRIG